MDRPIKNNKKKYIKLVNYISVIIVMFLMLKWFSSILFNEMTTAVEIKNIQIAPVMSGVVDEYMLMHVNAIPKDVAYVDTNDGGSVKEIYVNPGDIVLKDQPLVRLENTQLELQVLEQEGRLIQSITQLQNYQTSLEQNLLNNSIGLNEIEFNIINLSSMYKRLSAISDKGLSTEAEVEVLQKQFESLKEKQKLKKLSIKKLSNHISKQLPKLELQLAKLEKDLKSTGSKLDKLVVKSPYEGIITDMDLKLGQTLQHGNRIAELTLGTGFKLRQSIDEFYLHKITPNLEGIVLANGTEFGVKVSKIYPQIEGGSFQVDFSFKSSTSPQLVSGQSLSGRLFFDDINTSKSIYIKTGDYLNYSGYKWVYVASNDMKSASKRQIEIGKRNPDSIEILQGLSVGEKIIVSNYENIGNFEQVNLTSE